MSNLPPEIPPRFEQLALHIPDASHDELGWTKADAVAVIESLRGTKVAVAGGEVFKVNEWSQVRIDDWRCERKLDESASDFASRSQDVALTYFPRYQSDAVGSPVYVLWFEPQRAAA